MTATLSAYRADASRWREHIAPSELAAMRLTTIRPAHVAAWTRWLATRRSAQQVLGGGRERTGPLLSRQTQQHCLQLVPLCFQDAAIEGLSSSDPSTAIGVVPDDEGEDLDAWTWLTQEEITQLLRCSEIPLRTRLLYQVALYTGLRAGELWALTWDRVKLEDERPTLLVARSGRRRSTKSGKPRPVPLLPAAVEALRALGPGEPGALVFPATSGRQRRTGEDAGWADRSRGAQGVQRGWRSVARLREGIRFHDFRHICASHLLQGTWGRRWTLEEVRDFLGHSSITVTQRYAHLDVRRLHEAAAETPGSAPQRATDRATLPTPELPSPVGGPGGIRTHDQWLKGSSTSVGEVGVGVRSVSGGTEASRCTAAHAASSARELLRLAASGEPVPDELLYQVAAAALLELPAERERALQVLGGGPLVLAAAIILAGRLIDRPASAPALGPAAGPAPRAARPPQR